MAAPSSQQREVCSVNLAFLNIQLIGLRKKVAASGFSAAGTLKE